MIEDEVEDGADSHVAQCCHRGAQLRHATGAQPRIERHRHHRIVAPRVMQPERRQMPLVDPRDNRHQLDRADAKPLQMCQHHRMPDRRYRAAQRRRYVRVQHRQAAHIHFVDQPAGLKYRRAPGKRRQRRRRHRLRHQRRRLVAKGRKPRIVCERPVEMRRRRIDQQLGRIERRIARRSEAIVRPHRRSCLTHPIVARTGHRQPALIVPVKQT